MEYRCTSSDSGLDLPLISQVNHELKCSLDALQIPLDKELSVADLGISNGETLVLRAKEATSEAASAPPPEPTAAEPGPSFADLVLPHDLK